MNDKSIHRNHLDRAVAARLSKLAAVPVDTTQLKNRLDQYIQQHQQPTHARLTWQQWWRPITSAAAAVLIVALLGFMFVQSNSPAIAAPAELAKIHYDVTRNLTPVMQADNIEVANSMIASQSGNAQPLPSQLPGQVHSCCLHELAGAMLSCVLIELDGQRITIAVADAGDLRSPEGQTITRNGQSFVLNTANGVNIVMSRNNDRWLCVMSEANPDLLLDLAAQITF